MNKGEFYKNYLKEKLNSKVNGEIMTMEEFYADKAIVREPIFEINCVGLNDKPNGCPVCPTCKEPTYGADICHFCGQHFKCD